MAIGIIGKKVGMTQMYTPDGNLHAVTVVEAGPCTVLQVKTAENDGYNALQLGFGPKKIQLKSSGKEKGQKVSGVRKVNSVTRPMVGHFRAAGKGAFRHVKEFRLDSVENFAVGQEITLSEFKAGEKVIVVGRSKGKGFQGVMRRHKMSGQNMTHGSMMHRRVGSIGQCAFPSRVFKGKRMPGHQGDRQVTMRNLSVLSVDEANHLVFIRGTVPGPTNGVVYLRKSNA